MRGATPASGGMVPVRFDNVGAIKLAARLSLARGGIPFCVAVAGTSAIDRRCALIGATCPAKIGWRLIVVQQRDLVIDYQGLEYLGFATPRQTHWNLPSTTLVQLAVGRGEGRQVAAARAHLDRPHTGRSPNDGSSSTSRACVMRRLGQRQPAGRGAARAPALDQSAGACRAARAVRAGPARRRRPGAPTPRTGRSPRPPGTALRPQHVPRAAGGASSTFRPDFTVLQLPSLPGRSGDRRHPLEVHRARLRATEPC